MKMQTQFALLFTSLLTIGMAWLPHPYHSDGAIHSKVRKPPKPVWEKDARAQLKLGPQSSPSEWFFKQRAFPRWEIDEEAFRQAYRQANREAAARTPDEIDATWHLAGPLNIGGRITSVAMDPRDPNYIYAGAAFGGIYKSNGSFSGPQWQQIFSNAGSLSIGAIALAPGSEDTVYVGTGEVNSAADTYEGDGFWMSPNGGQTWQHRGLDSVGHIGRIAVNPRNPNVVYVAALGSRFRLNAHRGLYKSTDAGQTWTRILTGPNDSTGCVDVTLDPTHPDTIYAAMWQRLRAPFSSRFFGRGSTLKKSTNGGQTWTEILPTALRNREWCRIGVAVSPARPNRVYCSIVDTTLTLRYFYRSENYGSSWTQVPISSSLCSNFGWYFGNIFCSPVDSNLVYVHGVYMAQSTNAGRNWTYISQDVYNNVHVDYHGHAFSPDGVKQVWGNDGGIYFKNGSFDPFHIETLPLTQYYAICTDPNDPRRLYGGSQDNGTSFGRFGANGDWAHIYGGDGFYCIVDPTHPDSVYCEYQYGGLGKVHIDTLFAQYESRDAVDSIDAADRRNWNTPVVMSPQNSNVLYYGTYRVWKTTNGAVNWSAISPDLTGGQINTRYPTIATIGLSSLNQNIIWTGSDNGKVFVTTNGGTNWTDVSAGLPLRSITRVVCSPDTASIAYVTLSGFRWGEAYGRVYRTTDFGSTWSSIDNGLPDAPVNAMVIDPMHSSHLYVGNDVGVYRTTNLGTTWNTVASGLPVVTVYDLVLHPTARVLTAGTHGVSMWQVAIDSLIDAVGDGERNILPRGVEISRAYPNPFNGTTRFKIELTRTAKITAEILNLRGQSVTTLYRGEMVAGSHFMNWDAHHAASGIYWLRVNAEGKIHTQRLVLVK